MLKISNPDKVLFAESGITKIDVAQYYCKIADKMLPFIANRRLSLVVCPQGTGKPCFYKKNAAEGVVLDPIAGVNDLLAHVQNNTLEFHAWGSTIADLEHPDMMVFDLDPDEGMGLAQVRKGLTDIKRVLDELGLVSFLKTSGNKGYHVVVPIKPVADWSTVGSFAKNIAIIMEKNRPDLYTSNVRKVNRKGKIFIDWIRNGKGATSIVPYSVRAKEGAAVSAPLAWSELGRVAPDAVSMKDASKRADRADPWKNFWEVQKNQWIL